MKHLTTTIFTLFSLIGMAQNAEVINALVARNRAQVPVIEATNSTTTTLLPSTFAKDAVSAKATSDQLAELTIVKAYYVYTQFKQNPSFDQKVLDAKRFKELQKIAPEIVNDPYIEWQLIEQTGCNSPEEGRTYFHGFIFVHRPIQTPEERAAELKRLTAYLENPTDEFGSPELDPLLKQLNSAGTTEVNKGTTISPSLNVDMPATFVAGPNAMFEYLRSSLRNDQIVLKRADEWVKVKFIVDDTGEIKNIECEDGHPDYVRDEVIDVIERMPPWTPAIRDKQNVDSEINLDLRVSYAQSVNGLYTINGIRPELERPKLEEKPEDLLVEAGNSDIHQIALQNSSVYKGLELVNPTEKTALVMDVTGSMSDYIASMKRWISQEDRVKFFTSFTFFNDGDDKPTRQKVIGETGGIYLTKSGQAINELIRVAMAAGSGGERPESDVEAMIYAQEHDTLCDAILLIGDNYSEVRDIALLKRLHKKVNVLICAVTVAVRSDYINIAFETGGDLYYHGEVIDFKTTYESGERVFVGSATYKFNGRQFELEDASASSN